MVQYLHVYGNDMVPIRLFWVSIQTLGSQKIREWKHLDYSLMISDDKFCVCMIVKNETWLEEALWHYIEVVLSMLLITNQIICSTAFLL